MDKFSVVVADKIEVNKIALCSYLKEQPQFDAVALSLDFEESISITKNLSADVLFINSNIIKNQQQLENLICSCPQKTQIVYMGESPELALQAVDNDFTDYLLLPCTLERFEKCINKLQRRYKTNNSSLDEYIGRIVNKYNQHNEDIIVKDSSKIKVIDPNDVVWVGSAGNYVELHLHNEERPILHRETLSTMESTLKPSGFIRIHRSTLVKKRFISELKPTESGDYHVTLKNGQTLSLSRRFKSSMSGII